MTRKIRELKPEGNQTRPGPAVRKVLDDFRGSPPAAIVLFSDGVASTGDADRLSLAAAAAAANFVPIDAVGLGSEQPTRDIQLYDVTAEDLAFVGDPYAVTGKIKADGFAGRSVPVRLTERDTGRVLAETTVNLGSGDTHRCRLTSRMCRAWRARSTWLIEVPLARGTQPREQPRDPPSQRAEGENPRAPGRLVPAVGIPLSQDAV